MKLNIYLDVKVLTVSFNLSVFTFASGEQCRNSSPAYPQSPILRGCKVIGQVHINLYYVNVYVLAYKMSDLA